MNKGKSARGITLVALIITIIVLLILAVVAIRAINDGGIIEHAQDASDMHTEGDEKEKVNLAANGAFLTGMGTITQDNLTHELNSYFGEGKWTLVESTEEYFKIKINASNREYVIYTNGSVEATGVAPLISFDKSEITVNMENETSTTLTVSTNIEEDGTIQWVWTSSNETVATISGENDKTKTITFVGGGTSVITATYGENSVTCMVTVEGPIKVTEKDSIFTFASFDSKLKTVSVTGLKEEHKTSEQGKNLLIPDYVVRDYDGISYEVTKIKDRAFYSNTNIETLALPIGLKNIGESAFGWCSELKGTLTLPLGLQSIGESAFGWCSKLEGPLSIPDSVTSIGSNAFRSCSSLTGTINIPNGVTEIGNSVFYDCKSLTGSLTIPDSVTSIGSHTFYGCTGLTGSLSIPDSVTSIGAYAFQNCSGFTGTLTISNGVSNIGSGTFDSCSGFTGDLIIPSSVESIGREAFSKCSGVTGKLTIPDTVKKIEYGAFMSCSGLTGIVMLPEGLTDIESFAFGFCKNLEEIIVPTSIVSIGSSAFHECMKIKILKSSEEIKKMENCPWINYSGRLYDEDGNLVK